MRRNRIIFGTILFCWSFGLSAQPQHPLTATLKTGSNNKLISNFIDDTLYLHAWDKGNSTIKYLDSSDILISRGVDTAEIISIEPTSHLSTKEFAIHFVLDNSASMFHSYDSLTKYLDVFLDSMGGGANYSAMIFDNIERKPTYDGTSRVALFLASVPATTDRERIKSFWHSYDSIRTDYTPLYDAMWKSYEHIRDRRQHGDSARTEIMIIITDGEDNVSATSIERLRELADVMQVTTYVVNYRVTPADRLMWLIRRTRGRTFDAANLSELRRTIEIIRTELTTGYKIVFHFPFLGAGSKR